MAEWNDFFVAEAGASAALTGLVFVGVSLNLDKILAASALTNRALAALLLLLTVLIVSSLLLAPIDPPGLAHGAVAVAVTLVWLFGTGLDFRSYRSSEPAYRRHYVFHGLMFQAAILPYAVGVATLLTGGASGLTWITFAFVASFIVAAADAWVLLVEINR